MALTIVALEGGVYSISEDKVWKSVNVLSF